MKMLVDTDKMYKLAMTPDGQLSINLSNGKSLQGTLTAEEQEVVAVAITRISEHVIEFDPKPNDYIALHLADIQTLEQQAVLLDEGREKLKATEELLAKAGEELLKLQSESEASLKELDEVRPKLRDTSLVVQEQASQLATLRSELASTQQELNSSKGELLQAMDIVKKQREVINSTSPAEVIVPASKEKAPTDISELAPKADEESPKS